MIKIHSEHPIYSGNTYLSHRCSVEDLIYPLPKRSKERNVFWIITHYSLPILTELCGLMAKHVIRNHWMLSAKYRTRTSLFSLPQDEDSGSSLIHSNDSIGKFLVYCSMVPYAITFIKTKPYSLPLSLNKKACR